MRYSEAIKPTASAESRALTEAKLARGPLDLVELLDEIEFPAKTNLLVLVDQFEEIFRYLRGETSDEVDAFVALLLASASQRKRPIYIVITMRSDFLGECAQFNNLAETINDGQFHTPRLSRDQCRLAIEEPVRVYGGQVEEALVTRLLNDMGGNPDQLPLLQHALMLLSQRARERASDDPPLLTLADYESLGGIGTSGSDADTSPDAETRTSNGALSDHADRVLAELTSEQQRIAAILFRGLTEGEGAGGRAVRRPVSIADVAAIAEAPINDLLPVIEAFRAPGRNFLTPLPPEPLNPETIIDISHESLIRQWVKLRRWVREEYQSAEAYRGIERSAKQWQNGLGNLLTGRDLAAARHWRKTERPNAAWAARYGAMFGQVTEFLRASERHRFWRRGLAATAISVPVMLIAGAFWVMFYVITMILATLALNPAHEISDYGVYPQATLKENIGTETPTTIPHGHVISTSEVRTALQRGTLGGSPFILIDVLEGDHQTIPKANRIPLVGLPGDFQDETQHRLEGKLKALTGNKLDMPLVFFCMGVKCWESYNACLRAINLGYTQVYWYRGGLSAWRVANETSADLTKYDLSKIDIKLRTVISNIPGIARVVRQVFLQSGKHAAQLESINIDYYRHGVANAHEGKYDEAIRDFSKAIELNPQHVEAYYNRGLAHAKKGDYGAAMTDLLEAATLDPARNAEVQALLLDKKYASAYFQRGRIELAKGAYDRAIADYDQAIQLNPEYDEAYSYRGTAYYSKGDYGQAVKDYDQAIQINPKLAVAYVNRGIAYTSKSNYVHAIADFDAAIEIDSKFIQAYFFRGSAYLAKGDYDNAINDYEQTIRLNPNIAVAYFNRANAYQAKGDLDRAVADFDQAVLLDPKSAQSYNNRCIARMIIGQQLQQALSDCNQALRILPDNPGYLDSRGFAYLRLNRLDEAIVDFSAVLGPNLASSLYGRGLAKLKKGDRGRRCRHDGGEGNPRRYRRETGAL
jgi:PQQ-dependent catabolism-associated CXXCW motif protein